MSKAERDAKLNWTPADEAWFMGVQQAIHNKYVGDMACYLNRQPETPCRCVAHESGGFN